MTYGLAPGIHCIEGERRERQEREREKGDAKDPFIPMKRKNLIYYWLSAGPLDFDEGEGGGV